MGNKHSLSSSTVAVPPPFYLVPDIPVPSLKPTDLHNSRTAGKPILCAGWMMSRASASRSPDTVTYTSDVEVPPPQPHQVRVKIYAAGVNPADALGVSLQSFSAEAKHRIGCEVGVPLTSPYVMGIEGAGVVESIGSVTADSEGVAATSGMPSSDPNGLRVGDRVAFLADFTRGKGGTFCQYAVVDADTVWKLPEVDASPPSTSGDPAPGRLVDFVEAASLPAAAAAAYIALFDKLRVEAQRTIFISGASGGVGSVAVQLAHYFGLYVIASCSTANVQYVEHLGADYVVDYTRADVVKDLLKYTDGYGVDYLLECTDVSRAEAHSEVVRFGGSLCILTGLMASRGDLMFRRQLTVHYVFLGMFHRDPAARAQLQPLGRLVLQLYMQGAFSVTVEPVPFVQATAALEVVASGHGRGKLVLVSFHVDEDQEERRRRRRVALYEKAQRRYQAEEVKKKETHMVS